MLWYLKFENFDRKLAIIGLLCRGGATILRVEGTNITASEVSEKIFGVVPLICHSGGTTVTKRGVATISYWSCSCNFSQYLNTFQIPDVVFKYFSI